MKAYKASYNQVCKNQRYEVGETYTIDGKLIICENGFHFCYNPDDVFKYYEPKKDFILFEVELLGKIITSDDKSVTDKIKITRIIPVSEWNEIFINHKFDKYGSMIYKKEIDGYEEWFQYDQNNNCIHYKDSDGYQRWFQYDQNNNLIHYKTSDDYEYWDEFDENNNCIHYKDSDDYEYWQEFDQNNRCIHCKTSNDYETWYE